MRLPFSTEQFFGAFRAYNQSVWPIQVILVALALLAVVLVVIPRRHSGAGVSGVLSLLWIWVGAVYHLLFFAAINPLAYVFSALSIAEGILLFRHGVIQRKLMFGITRSAPSLVGIALIVFALTVYPIWSILAGHRYPDMPTFGLPCPVTLFTIGMLGLAVRPFPRIVLAVPLVWCLVGAQAAFLLDVPQDLGLLVAALFATFLLVTPGRSGSVDRLHEA